MNSKITTFAVPDIKGGIVMTVSFLGGVLRLSFFALKVATILLLFCYYFVKICSISFNLQNTEKASRGIVEHKIALNKTKYESASPTGHPFSD